MENTSRNGLSQILHLSWRRRRITVGVPILAALVVGIISLILAPVYTATTTFVPEASTQAGRLPAGLASLATQFGFPLGTEASKSPKFYAEVVRSRELMERVLLSNYLDPRRSESGSADSTTLLRILEIKGRDRADSLYRGVKKMNRLVTVSVNTATNIVTLNVDSHYPGLSAAIANNVVGYLNAFNTEYRQSQAREQRRFVEDRLAVGERDLRQAEEELRTFYERNRSWQQSPQLTFEEGRLRRQVELQQELYISLKREYENARIQEVNDTPVITVIDVATAPVRKSKPKRTLLVAMALVLGVMISVSWVAAVDYLAVNPYRPENRTPDN